MLRAVRFIVFEPLAGAVEFVQQLFEPELVYLVDDDEEQLVVLRALRARLLQGQQFVDFQVARIGDGGVGHALSPVNRSSKAAAEQTRTGRLNYLQAVTPS